ncbi:MAG: hypothetical protein ABJC79_02220 [Acidimicrobiia bacterium]
MALGVAIFVLVGYVVCLIPARLCHRDIGSFRRTLWVGFGKRDSWRKGIVAAYLAFGWPSLVFALNWWNGQTRRALVELRTQMQEQSSMRP